MAIVAHGTAHLVERFGKLVRESLGPQLGAIFELPTATDSQMKFTEKIDNLPPGAGFTIRDSFSSWNRS